MAFHNRHNQQVTRFQRWAARVARLSSGTGHEESAHFERRGSIGINEARAGKDGEVALGRFGTVAFIS